MRNWFPLALAAVLICSLPAAAFSGGFASEPSDRRSGDSNHAVTSDGADWLAPSNGSVASGADDVGIDVSTALDGDANRLESRYEEYRIDARLEGATSDAERRAILREETSRLSDAATSLHERERQAYTAYYDGEIGERELLIELAAIHARAAVIEGSVTALGDRAENVSGLSLDERLETAEVKAVTLQGPVRNRAAAMLRGETEPTRIHIETDGDGVALAMVEGGRFYRETYRADNRNPNGTARLRSLGETEDRVGDLYPEIAPQARWSYSEAGYGTHKGVGNYSGGSITMYLDQATGEVYREHRTLRLDRVETAPVETATQGGVELTVHGTVPGGPARIGLADANTGAPLSGEVAVDGRTVGTTDNDGEIWVVMPRESMSITGSTGSTTVEAIVNSSDRTTARISPDRGDGLSLKPGPTRAWPARSPP